MAAPLRSPRSHPAAGSGDEGLLGLRRASWPFDRALIRSPLFVDLSCQADDLDAQLEELRPGLIDRLFELVPAVAPPIRRRVLALKRAVYNRRPLPRPLPDLGSDRLDLERYDALIRRRLELFAGALETVAWELDARLIATVDRPDFRLALAVSSPDLTEAVDQGEELPDGLSPRARGLYAYLCRFATKANPLHLFARLVPGARMGGLPPGPSCEIVLDVAGLLELERSLLGRLGPTDPIPLQLRPLQRQGDRWQAWLPAGDGWRRALLRDSPLLSRLDRLARERKAAGGAPVWTRRELRAALAAEPLDSGAAESRPDLEAAIDVLIGHGLLAPYLISDLFAPAKDLRGIDPALDPVATRLERWHLARVSMAELPLVAEGDRADAGRGLWEERPGHQVNGYADDDLEPAEAAAAEVIESLRRLVPLLARENNFSPVERVVRSFYRERLEPGERRPYLELLAEFLRRREEILERARWGRDAPEHDELSRCCAATTGVIDEEGIARLLAGLGPTPARSLCCTGPFDFERRRFYLTNLFAGEQRFVSRFLLARRRQPGDVQSNLQDSTKPLDVELAVPPLRNLCFVVRRFDVGFGFEARWANGYRYWLDPTDVEVTLENGRPGFFHAASGRRVHFHYQGLLLAQYLPVEYQMLLVDHGDSYHNPFDTDPDLDGLDGPIHRTGARFGPVWLRRDTWYLPAATLARELAGASFLEACHAVRKRIRRELADGDLWYYRLPGAGRRGEKPRQLDLASPLSLLAFRRALGGAPPAVALTAMEPDPAGLWHHGGEGYAAELMVEVAP